MGQIETLPVIRVVMAGTVTSFRYPFTMQGYQLTYEMPPPSTIHGHICSAAGEWIEPDESLLFGYHFIHAGKFVDYKEHLYFGDPIQPFPFERELLFQPRLTLYVTQLDLFGAFVNPHFAVVLGRSQDLMTYLSVQVIELERRERGYFEHTILPQRMAPRLGKGTISVTMPQFVDQRRHPYRAVYVLLQDRAVWPPPEATSNVYDEDEPIRPVLVDETIDLWVDPTSPVHPKDPALQRAVWLHSFV